MGFDLQVSKRLGDAEIALRLEAGEGLTVLFGPSGAGKTSVLHMVAGLLWPDRGHIRVGGIELFGDGIDVPPERRRAGYVFQEARLFPHLKVAANLRYGRFFTPAAERWRIICRSWPSVAAGNTTAGMMPASWLSVMVGCGGATGESRRWRQLEGSNLDGAIIPCRSRRCRWSPRPALAHRRV